MTNLCCKIKYCILLVMMCKQNRRCPSLAIYASLDLQPPRKTKWHKNFFLGDKKMFRNNLCELVDGQSGVAQVLARLNKAHGEVTKWKKRSNKLLKISTKQKSRLLRNELKFGNWYHELRVKYSDSEFLWDHLRKVNTRPKKVIQSLVESKKEPRC